MFAGMALTASIETCEADIDAFCIVLIVEMDLLNLYFAMEMIPD